MAYNKKNRPTGNAMNAKQIIFLEKVHAAMELRKRGLTFQEIADACGWASRSGPFNALMKYFDRLLLETSEQVLQLELLRLDELLSAVWDQAMAGSVPHVNAVLKIMERRSRFLGLDAATKKDVTLTVTEAPQAPADLTDYNIKLLQVLHSAGAIELGLPSGMEALGSTQGVVDVPFSVVPSGPRDHLGIPIVAGGSDE